MKYITLIIVLTLTSCNEPTKLTDENENIIDENDINSSINKNSFDIEDSIKILSNGSIYIEPFYREDLRKNDYTEINEVEYKSSFKTNNDYIIDSSMISYKGDTLIIKSKNNKLYFLSKYFDNDYKDIYTYIGFNNKYKYHVIEEIFFDSDWHILINNTLTSRYDLPGLPYFSDTKNFFVTYSHHYSHESEMIDVYFFDKNNTVKSNLVFYINFWIYGIYIIDNTIYLKTSEINSDAPEYEIKNYKYIKINLDSFTKE